MSVEEVGNDVKKFFGGVALAVSEGGDFSGYVIIRVYEPETEDDLVAILLVAGPAMTIPLRVTKIEEKENEWLVSTSNKDRWALRVLPEDDRKEYIAGMRSEGYVI